MFTLKKSTRIVLIMFVSIIFVLYGCFVFKMYTLNQNYHNENTTIYIQLKTNFDDGYNANRELTSNIKIYRIAYPIFFIGKQKLKEINEINTNSSGILRLNINNKTKYKISALDSNGNFLNSLMIYPNDLKSNKRYFEIYN